MHITPITFGFMEDIINQLISRRAPPCKVDAPRNQFQICSPLPSWTINTSLFRTQFHSISPGNGRINGKIDGFLWFPVKIFRQSMEFHPNFPGNGRKPNIGLYRVKRRVFSKQRFFGRHRVNDLGRVVGILQVQSQQ